MSSPTQRSLALLRKSWPLVQVTEKWNQFAKVRQDLYGFVDVLCCGQDSILAVQTTTGANVSARYEKLRYLPSVVFWLQSPTRLIHIHGWATRGARGKRKLWTCRTVELRLGPTGAVEMAQESCKVCGETIKGQSFNGLCGLCADDAFNKRAREMAQEGEK